MSNKAYSRYLNSVDVLTAKPVTLLVDGNSHYTTICGSVLSLLMACISVAVALAAAFANG
jgi:hypothetical protein